jgi:riboflavin kinase/FMN adenylyltransferase
MKILRDLPDNREGISDLVLTIGNFDGVHLGHQAIFKQLIHKAVELDAVSAVLTFDPHPLKVMRPDASIPLLTTWEDKMNLLEELGIELVICLAFTENFARLTKEQFVEKFLVQYLRVRELFVGHDFAFGYRREGSLQFLQEMGKTRGFKVNIVEPVEINGTIVSSSLIRRLIQEGSVSQASSMLGRNYVIKGQVVQGYQVGKKLGFPTANLFSHNELVPGPGIYAVKVIVQGTKLVGVVNIGTCPTFERKELSIEVHILNFHQNIYDQIIELEFYERLRGERRFESPNALADQIKKDIELTEKIVQI